MKLGVAAEVTSACNADQNGKIKIWGISGVVGGVEQRGQRGLLSEAKMGIYNGVFGFAKTARDSR